MVVSRVEKETAVLNVYTDAFVPQRIIVAGKNDTTHFQDVPGDIDNIDIR